MLKEDLINDMMKAISQGYADSHTKLFPCAKIYSYANKRSYKVGNQVVIESGKIVNSQEVPTHEITLLEGTLADSKHCITLKELSTGNILKIDL